MKRILSLVLAIVLAAGLLPVAGTPQAAAVALDGVTILIPPTLEYDMYGPFSEGFAIVRKNGKLGYIDRTGTLVIPLEYDWANDFREGLACVEKTISAGAYKYGYIDKTGKVVVPLEYDFADNLFNGFSRVMKDDKWGLIDKTGKMVVPLIYDHTGWFCEDLADVVKTKWGFIDKTGKVIIPLEYDRVEYFSEGLAAVRNYDSSFILKWGFIDKTGKVVVPLEYDHVNAFSEGLAYVSKDGKYGYIDKTGKVVVPLIYDVAFNINFTDGLVRVSKLVAGTYKYGFVDKTGKVVVPLEYDSIDDYFHGEVAVAVKDGQLHFIDKSGGFVTSLGAYDNVWWEGEENGQWIAETINGELYLIDKTGKVLAGPYEYAEECGGLFEVTDFAGNDGVISREGKILIPPGAYARISTWENGLVWFWENGKWGLLKLEGYGDIVVPSTTPDDAAIDLNAETITLPSGFTVAAYSINGGTKWKKGALPTEQAKFSKLFNKELTLWVADTVDKKGKPTSDANIIKFPKINARPKANPEKLKPYFDAETWTLKTKTGGEAAKTYEWAPTTDKKKPSGNWQIVPSAGFPVLSGKAKTTYLLRTPATESDGTYTPAGKIFKVTPANFGKAPNYAVKTDRKTSVKTVKLKANDWYQLGGGAPVKLTAKETLDVTDKTGTLTVWKGETGKKPRSEVQVVTLG